MRDGHNLQTININRMRTKFIFIIGVVCLLTSCVKEGFEDFTPTPTPGKEVIFSANINGNTSTKTTYGEEVNNASPIYWVHGNLVSVYGSTCSVNQAEYKVSTTQIDQNGNDIGDPATQQNYASALRKTGAAGVQWGSEGTSDFYAVYPSTSHGFTDILDAEGNVIGATVRTSISNEQKVKFVLNGNTWSGVHYDNDLDNPNWKDAVMYACTVGAKSTDEKGNPAEVKLRFKPFSNVLRFNFAGYEAVDANGDPNIEWSSLVYVSKITLTAPNTKIAGDFNLNIYKDLDENGEETGTGTAAAVNNDDIVGSGSSNSITVIPNYLPLSNVQNVVFDIFTIPSDAVMSKENPWTVTLETTSGIFTYKLIPKIIVNDVPTQSDVKLKAGLIHKVAIPELKIKKAFEIPANNWIRYIPRNTYLSEISMPGAWYATNSDYQGSVTLGSMYSQGIRAFNIDCRMTASADSWEKKWYGYDLKNNPTYVLQCAGSETLTGQNVLGVVRVGNVADGHTVESQLEAIASQIKDTEFVMVILTIAEKPKDLSGALSDVSETFGNNTNPANILAAIKDILSRKGSALKVFGYREQDKGKTLNANTTVSDVLNSMIIKINVNVDQDVVKSEDGTITSGVDLSSYGLSNVLISEGSMASETKYTAAGNNASLYPNIVLGSFTDMNTANMYWGSVKITNPEMTYYYHQAQLTTSSTTASSGTTTPSLYDREKAIDKIIEQSDAIYSRNLHNALFQLGIGGYISSNGEDRATVASTLNKYVLDKVNAKLATTPSPIGMVLMNFCTNSTYKGPELTKAILEMNHKFTLNSDPNVEEWPDGNPFVSDGSSSTNVPVASVSSDDTVINGGNAF